MILKKLVLRAGCFFYGKVLNLRKALILFFQALTAFLLITLYLPQNQMTYFLQQSCKDFVLSRRHVFSCYFVWRWNKREVQLAFRAGCRNVRKKLPTFTCKFAVKNPKTEIRCQRKLKNVSLWSFEQNPFPKRPKKRRKEQSYSCKQFAAPTNLVNLQWWIQKLK